jgi:HEAT repeat protein
VAHDRDLAIAWRGLVARWSAILDPDCKKKSWLFGPRVAIEKKLLATEAGRNFLTSSLEDQAEVVRLAAAAALVDTGSVAARLVLEALAATHSPNAISAQIILGNYPPRIGADLD